GGRLIRAVLLGGLLGTFSTGAFAVVVVMFAVGNFLRSGMSPLRHAFGLAVLGVAGWAAIYAPILGVAQKERLNSESLEARAVSTQAGVDALWSSPLTGGQAAA